MEIKEQIKEIVIAISKLVHTDTICVPDVVCTFNCDECWANYVLPILNKYGFFPIQAGEDGLVNECNYKRLPFYCMQDIDIIPTLKAQKALTESQAKQKQAEAVKKVLQGLDKIKDFLSPEIKDRKYAIDCINELKQTLEELEK